MAKKSITGILFKLLWLISMKQNSLLRNVGNQYIIPTLAVWDSVEDIDIDALPNQFVLKSTHDSGGIVICKDKSSFDFEAAKAKLSASLKRDYSKIAREWPYQNVPRRIIAEEYISELGNDDLLDYKMFSFHGEPKLTVVCSDRFSKTGTRMNFYDINWGAYGDSFWSLSLHYLMSFRSQLLMREMKRPHS